MPSSSAFVSPTIQNGFCAPNSWKSNFCSLKSLMTQPSQIRVARRRPRHATPVNCIGDPDPWANAVPTKKGGNDPLADLIPMHSEHLDEEMKKLEGTSLKWAEIDFPTIESELDAIDEWMREEEIEEGEAWSTFLKACAYEKGGQAQLALAQFSKIETKVPMSMIPNVWERRAYNMFKTGRMFAADSMYDISVRLLTEALGNELHIAHMFEETFGDFMPRHFGPSYAVQRGIAKYCTRNMLDARQALAPALIVRDLGHEHGVLWLLAASIRTGNEVASTADMRLIDDWRKNDIPADMNKTLRSCFDLFYKAAKFPDADLMVEVLEVEKSGMYNGGIDELIAAIYLGLYHDTVDGAESLRDEWFAKVAALPPGPSPNDTLDFVYHAARHGLGLKNLRKEKEEADPK